eukprot:7386784-Prymnesium_polylepis.1
MVAVIRDALIAAVGQQVRFDTIEAHSTFLRVRLCERTPLEPIGVTLLALTILLSVVLAHSLAACGV